MPDTELTVKLLEEPAVEPQHARTSPRQDAAAFDRSLDRLTQLFRILAEPTRLRILYLLLEAHECHVRALCDSLGQSQPAVSHHLAQLRLAGLIECRRQGKHNFYRLTTRAIEELLARLLDDSNSASGRIRLGRFTLICQEQA
jgi:ArsR family transcriptional regulator